ncbi:heme-binding protein soul2 [Phycodurus eques]|uniref:heme-binding protein soul2 n=1 Tax=Phycodurus eques TaxID=693459 RepID=UPI002ACEF80D|nr:heme-binding protein soul2 [Phycodurus eques]
MEQSLSSLSFLVLVSLCKALTINDICTNGRPCPEYTLVALNEDFESRLYVETRWITTQIKDDQIIDVIAAHNRLKNFCDRQKAKGFPMPNSWPVLITFTEGANANMSWFVPNETEVALTSDTDVVLQTRPRGTVYVKKFRERPSKQTGQKNKDKLQEALRQAGKSFVNNRYSGAGYTSYYALQQYNEIWMTAL